MITIDNIKEEQIEFFNQLEKLSSSPKSFIAEISDLLNIARTAVYARRNGTVFISIYEQALLNEHFAKFYRKKFFSHYTRKVRFEVSSISKHYTVHKWLSDTLQLLTPIAKDPDAHIYYTGANLHLFYNFSTPKLAAFYIYWLHKYILQSPEYQLLPFSWKRMVQTEEVKLATQIWKKYQEISSTEIWTRYILITTLDKIKEMRRDKFFESDKEYKALSEDIIEIMALLDQQAELGHKIDNIHAKYSLFSLESKHESNCAIIKYGHSSSFFDLLNNRTIMMTTDKDFCEAQLREFKQKIKNSKPLSSTNRTERTRILSEYRAELMKAIVSAN